MTPSLPLPLVFLAVCTYLMNYRAPVTLASREDCGSNPLKPILSVAEKTGESILSVLAVLRDVHSPAHDSLLRDFHNYHACLGLLETGYFRKRSPPRFERQAFIGPRPFFSSASSARAAAPRPWTNSNWEELQRLIGRVVGDGVLRETAAAASINSSKSRDSSSEQDIVEGEDRPDATSFTKPNDQSAGIRPNLLLTLKSLLDHKSNR